MLISSTNNSNWWLLCQINVYLLVVVGIWRQLDRFICLFSDQHFVFVQGDFALVLVEYATHLCHVLGVPLVDVFVRGVGNVGNPQWLASGIQQLPRSNQSLLDSKIR